MTIKADLHCHTIASDHAYSTIMELAKTASEQDMELIAITDHGTAIPDAPHIWHFENLRYTMPETIFGVKMLAGAEVNIVNLEGDIDIEPRILGKLDVVIASWHNPCGESGSVEENTHAYMNVVKNPHVDIIGHSGSVGFIYDYETVLKAAREHDKIIEINNHTFEVRKSSTENCAKIARLCKEIGVKICVSSDAHICTELGEYSHALRLLDEIDFPPELVMNTSADKILTHLNGRLGRDKI